MPIHIPSPALAKAEDWAVHGTARLIHAAPRRPRLQPYERRHRTARECEKRISPKIWTEPTSEPVQVFAKRLAGLGRIVALNSRSRFGHPDGRRWETAFLAAFQSTCWLSRVNSAKLKCFQNQSFMDVSERRRHLVSVL